MFTKKHKADPPTAEAVALLIKSMAGLGVAVAQLQEQIDQLKIAAEAQQKMINSLSAVVIEGIH